MEDKSTRERFIRSDLEFQKLYKSYFATVFRHVNYLLGGRSQLAEEIAQEAFIKLYTSPPVTQDNLAAWLLKVATNTVYNYLKSEKHRIQREDKVYNLNLKVQSPNSPEDTYLRNQQILAVKAVLDQLQERDRICLLLKFSGFRYSEIAEIIGVQESSIGTILARAQARFKKEFIAGNGVKV